MDFTLFGYQMAPTGNPPTIYFEKSYEACRQTALEQRRELADDEGTAEIVGLITIYECRMRMPTQAELMACLNTPDDPRVLFDALILNKMLVESM